MTNREYMINLLLDGLESRLNRVSIDDGGASEEAMIYSDLSDYMAKIDELERKLIRQRRKKVQIRTEIRERIEELDNEKEKDVLTKRYIDCEGWNRICDETGYRWTQVHRNHSEALKKFKMV